MSEATTSATAMPTVHGAFDYVVGFEWKSSTLGNSVPVVTLTVGDLAFAMGSFSSLGADTGIVTTATGLSMDGVITGLPHNTWRTVRFVARGHGGLTDPMTPATRTAELYVNGSIAATGTVVTWAPATSPVAAVRVAMSCNTDRLDDYYGAHADDTWYELDSIGETIQVRNIFVSMNGVCRYYDPCTDGHSEWSRDHAPAYHSPRFGETLPITETANGLEAAPTAMAYFRLSAESPIQLKAGYYPTTGHTCYVDAAWWKRQHRMLHCVSGAEMRGYLVPEREAASPLGVMPLFWPRYNNQRRASSILGPYEFEVTPYYPLAGSDPRDDDDWTEPTLNALGTLQRARYAAEHPDETLPQRLESDGAGPTTASPDYTANYYRPSERGDIDAYNAVDGNHDRASWHTKSGEGGGSYPHWCGQDSTGRPVIVAYEQEAGIGGINARWNPVLRLSSDNELATLRARVIASEDATAVIEPVSGEVVIVALQDTWASTDLGDYDVTLCSQRLGYDGAHDLAAPQVLATLGAADLAESWQIADAYCDCRGALWVAVWRVAAASVGAAYTTMQALIYRSDAPDAAADLVFTINVNRPPQMAGWFIADTTADEIFFAYQDTSEGQAVAVHRLPQLDGEVVESYSITAGDGALPTPPYGDWWTDAQDLPYRLLALWVDEAGRWRARWCYGEWFNAYDTCSVAVKTKAENTAEVGYHHWPAVYPDLTPDTRLVGPPPEFMEDLTETEADRHPVTLAAVWGDRNLMELWQAVPA